MAAVLGEWHPWLVGADGCAFVLSLHIRAASRHAVAARSSYRLQHIRPIKQHQQHQKQLEQRLSEGSRLTDQQQTLLLLLLTAPSTFSGNLNPPQTDKVLHQTARAAIQLSSSSPRSVLAALANNRCPCLARPGQPPRLLPAAQLACAKGRTRDLYAYTTPASRTAAADGAAPPPAAT